MIEETIKCTRRKTLCIYGLGVGITSKIFDHFWFLGCWWGRESGWPPEANASYYHEIFIDVVKIQETKYIVWRRNFNDFEDIFKIFDYSESFLTFFTGSRSFLDWYDDSRHHSRLTLSSLLNKEGPSFGLGNTYISHILYMETIKFSTWLISVLESQWVFQKGNNLYPCTSWYTMTQGARMSTI